MSEKARAIKRAFTLEVMSSSPSSSSESSNECIIWLDEDTLKQYKLIIDQYTIISLDYIVATSSSSPSEANNNGSEKLKIKIHAKIKQQQKRDTNATTKKQAIISKYLYNIFIERIKKAFPNEKDPTTTTNLCDTHQILVFISDQVNREDAVVASQLRMELHSVVDSDLDMHSPIISTILSNRNLVRDLVLMNSERFKSCFQSHLIYSFKILELTFRFKFVGFSSSSSSSSISNNSSNNSSSSESPPLSIFKINKTTQFNIVNNAQNLKQDEKTSTGDENDNDESFDALVKRMISHPDIPIYHDVISELVYYILHERSHILISGEGGVGKTFMVRHTLEQLSSLLVKSIHFEKVFISATDMFQSGLGESENALKKLLSTRPQQQPPIPGEKKKRTIKLVVIDDIDNMLPSDSRVESGRIDKSLISELVHFFDIQSLQPPNVDENNLGVVKTILIGITSNSDRIDGSLIRVNRLEKEIEMKIPSPNQRLSILRYIMKKYNVVIDNAGQQQQQEYDSKMKSCQLDTQGFVWADFIKLQSILEMEKMERGSTLSFDSLKRSIALTKPKTYYQERPSSSSTEVEEGKLKDFFSENLAGIDKIIDQVKLSVIYPFLKYDKYVDMGIQVPKGMLIHGPNGVGKSTLAMCIARECKANFISVQCPDILSKVVGESSRAIKQLFVTARNCAPCILFFDQFDSIARSRNDESSGGSSSGDKMLSTLLIEMDGVHQHYKKTSSLALGDDEMAQNDNVFILAATNRIDLLDSAVLRPGRIDQHVYLALPDEESRRDILLLKTDGMPIRDSAQCINDMAKRTSAFSGADLDNLCREAAILCLREDFANEFIELRHFEKALQSITKIRHPNK